MNTELIHMQRLVDYFTSQANSKRREAEMLVAEAGAYDSAAAVTEQQMGHAKRDQPSAPEVASR